MLPITVQWNTAPIASVPIFGLDTKQANFQQETGLISEVSKINTAIYTYPQIKGTASEKSDSDIWKWIGYNISGKAGSNSQGSWKDNQQAVIPKLQAHREAITRLDDKNAQQDESIAATKKQLNEVNSRLSSQVGTSSLLGGLGVSMPIILLGGLAAFLLLNKK